MTYGDRTRGETTKADGVYLEMRNQILYGVLEPGSRVDYLQLSASLGVSITPLREALRRLEADHLVIRIAHRDVIVAPLTREEATDLVAVRQELDLLGARLAAVQMTEDELAVARELVESQDEQEALRYLRDAGIPVAVGGMLNVNRAFHRMVYCGSHNQVLIQYRDAISTRTERYVILARQISVVPGEAYRLMHTRLATIGRMASSVSHDLRHHLSAIYANAEFMSLANTGSEERTELLLEVKDAVQGMTDLIESLLLFSQTGQVLHLQYESIGLLVERVVHTIRQHPECRDVHLSFESPQMAEAFVDGPKLGRALYNLALNACQATRTGAGSRMVTIKLSEDVEKIRIAVSDTGRGIPDSIRQTLFQPFVSAGKVNGTGLGLTVAQHIAQEHGGEIRLEKSVPGETIFSVLLYKKALQALSRSLAVSRKLVDEIPQQQLVVEGGIESRQENR